MGIIYQSMISEIIQQLPEDRTKVELFLKNKEERFKQEYNLPDCLFYLNIREVLKRIEVESDYFEAKFLDSQKDVFNED